MLNESKVTVTCDGAELLSWNFEFPQENAMRQDIHVTCGDDSTSGWVIKETIGPSIVNTRWMEESLTGPDMADRRRDDNLRNVFGG